MYYRQLSAEIKIKNHKMFGVNKTGINLKIFSLSFVENYLYYDAIHDYLVWMKTALNPADNNQFRFRSHTGNY